MPNGIYVTKVAEGSAAEKAGIQKGDILTEFDGKEVTSMENMQEILKYYKAGKKVKVKVQVADNGTYKEKELTVKLGKRPSEQPIVLSPYISRYKSCLLFLCGKCVNIENNF